MLEEPLSASRWVGLASQVLEALEGAHQRGLVHGDLRPGRLVLYKTGQAKLDGLGLAQLRPSPGEDESMLGVRCALSPECIRGRSAEARSDLYSLAASLVALSTGRPLFQDFPEGHLYETPDLTELPAPLRPWLARALAKSPSDRHDSAARMRRELHEILGIPSHQASPGVPEVAPEPEPQQPPKEEPTRLAPPPPPEGMVHVPGGELVSRLQSATVPIAPFHLAVHPVTNREYEEFVVATDAVPPPSWPGTRPPPELVDHPVVEVSMAEASAYAAWRGWRLPTDQPRWSDHHAGRDHAVVVDYALYSVPFALGECDLRIRSDRKTVKLYLGSQLVKTHPRQPQGGTCIDPQDLPPGKAALATRDATPLCEQGDRFGPHIGEYARRLAAGTLPWSRIRHVYALLGLARRFGSEAADDACARALEVDVVDVTRIKRMLENGLVRRGLLRSTPTPAEPAGTVLRFQRPKSAFATGGSDASA